MKTSELTGAALDWAVMTCEGYVQPKPIEWILGGHFTPSTNWAQGGPIIEREGIAVREVLKGSWVADLEVGFEEGPTPLIAAMRCWVASKLGDEVEVPDDVH
jgi:hypothetical protein